MKKITLLILINFFAIGIVYSQSFTSNSACNCIDDIKALKFGGLSTMAQAELIIDLDAKIQETQQTIDASTKKDTIIFNGTFVLTKQGKRNAKLREQIKLHESEKSMIRQTITSGYEQVEFTNSKIDSFQINFEGQVLDEFIGMVQKAGILDDKLFIDVTNQKLSRDSVDFSILQPRFMVQRMNSTKDGSFVIFSDAQNNQLFALSYQTWDYIAKATKRKTVLGAEVQDVEVIKFENEFGIGPYQSIESELEFYVVEDKKATIDWYKSNYSKEKRLDSDNITLIFKDNDLDFKSMGSTGNGNIAIYAENDSAVFVWALKNNSLIESFISKYAPAEFITLEGGLNYSLNIDEFSKELYTVNFWVNKVKSDTMLQGCFGTTRISNLVFNPDDSKPFVAIESTNKDYTLIAYQESDLNSNYILTKPDGFPAFYSLDKEGVEKKIAYAIQNIMTRHAYMSKLRKESIEAHEAEETKRAKFKQELTMKYGAKYTEAALNGDIIVGMPDALIQIPLRVWSIDANKQWGSGYRIYCHSKINTANKLLVTVQNGKVKSVTGW
jgi:hypothetical protein